RRRRAGTCTPWRRAPGGRRSCPGGRRAARRTGRARRGCRSVRRRGRGPGWLGREGRARRAGARWCETAWVALGRGRLQEAELEFGGLRHHAGVPRRIEDRSEEHTSELQSPDHLVCRLLLEKKKKKQLNN